MFQTNNSNSVQQINQSRQIAQQLIQQTQQASMVYRQLMQQEQQNAQMLDHLQNREKQAVKTIEQALIGHDQAIQRCQEVINLCNQLEQGVTSQLHTQHTMDPMHGYQPYNQNQAQASFRQQ